MTPLITILSPGTFYTYLWLRKDGSPYYVGKGTWVNRKDLTRQRAYRGGLYCPQDMDRIILQDHPTEADAFAAEIFFIAFYGRKDLGTGILWNHTNGGDGVVGRKFSDEQRRRMSEARKGRPMPFEAREKIRQAKLGVPKSIEERRKMSESKKGKPIVHYDSVVHSERMMGAGNPMFGIKRSFDEEWCRKLSLGKMGHIHSEQTKNKIAEGNRKFRQEHPRTHCYKGHIFNGDNVKISSSGNRYCVTCRRENAKLRERVRRAERRIRK